jgi:hypothetical protein
MEKNYNYTYKQRRWSARDYAFCVIEGLDFTVHEAPDNILFKFHTKEDYDVYCEYQLRELQCPAR